jgi:hypothetical protein
VAAKRSPILGYNHNVRYRGVVFHVQTEDSGIANPHVFTHLFHKGVIISTRKLVYDADAAEETVKALMQSQHKAVLRDLKNGAFDDKIDAYLPDTPGLIPRDAEAGSGRAETAPVDVGAPGEVDEDPTVPVDTAPTHDMAALSRAPTESTDSPSAASPGLPPIPPRTVTPPPIPAQARRTQPRSAMGAPPVVTRPAADPGAEHDARRDVSQAFAAMLVDDAGGVAEVHSPAPPSVDVPPGAAPERPGQYAQHRRRESGPLPRDEAPEPAARRATTAPARPSNPPRTQPPPIPPRSGEVVRARPPTPRAQVPPGRVTTPPGVREAAPPAVGRTATPARAQTRSRAPSGGGVVMSKPAVIVGAPPRVIGGGSPAVAGRTPTSRVRKAREDSESGMFGQDLISEKSLDEVILAYLSEDNSEDGQS